MKLLFFTDTHIRSTNPRNRIDDFYKSTIDKLKEIRDYANDNKVDYVIHGGDLFDRPDSAIKPTSEVGKILSSFHMPIFIVAGNHDIFGYNQETLSRTMLGLLDSFELLRLIPEDGLLLESEEIDVLLVATPYSSELDLDKNNYIIKKEDYKYKADLIINIAHGFLTDRPFLKYVPHILINEILDTDADITLSGHYHTGYKTQVIEGKYFSNPGSMVRISNSISEMTRRPKFIELDLNKEGIKLTDIYLKSAKAGDEVLDRKTLIESQYRNERLMIFSDSIDQTIDLELINLDMILESIASSEDFEPKVRTEAKLRIERAKEKINAQN